VKTPKFAVIGLLLAGLSLSGCSTSPVELVKTLSPTPTSTVSAWETQNFTDRFAALARYAALERATLPHLLAAYQGLYSNIEVEEHFYGISYTYTYAVRQSGFRSVSALKDGRPALQALGDSQVFPAIKQAGVQDAVTLQYIYLNPDGSTIWTTLISPSTNGK
jgi:hypothetical protein